MQGLRNEAADMARQMQLLRAPCDAGSVFPVLDIRGSSITARLWAVKPVINSSAHQLEALP